MNPGTAGGQVKSYRELLVWQKGMAIAARTLEVAERLQVGRHYTLANQVERAAISVPANIAEGYGRTHLGDYLHHLSIANGSLKELETLLLLTARRGYAQTEILDEILRLADELGRMLTSLLRSLKRRRKNGA